jgi:hypothetical protein
LRRVSSVIKGFCFIFQKRGASFLPTAKDVARFIIHH